MRWQFTTRLFCVTAGVYTHGVRCAGTVTAWAARQCVASRGGKRQTMARTVLAIYAVLWRAAASCRVMSRGKLWRATSCGNCRWETGTELYVQAELAQGTTRCSQQEIRTPCSCSKALTRGPGGRYDHQAHSTYICQSHIRMRWHPHTLQHVT